LLKDFSRGTTFAKGLLRIPKRQNTSEPNSFGVVFFFVDIVQLLLDVAGVVGTLSVDRQTRYNAFQRVVAPGSSTTQHSGYSHHGEEWANALVRNSCTR
jgi:hypothetical protein